MKISVNVDNGLFNLNGQQINLDHLGQNHTGYDTTKRQPEMMSFGKPITALVCVGSVVPLCVVPIFGRCVVLRCDGSREPAGGNPYANPLYAPQTWKHELGLKGVLEAYVGQKHVLFGTAGNSWRQGLCSETASFR